ncbi:MAG: M6 family metalloprotease domain-containing protein [Lentisphaerae bacterium]|nr:M6 family metalloprotease domain-containing protein [Lentisphaerota bacterium]
MHRRTVLLMTGVGSLWMNAAWAVPACPDGLVVVHGEEPVQLQLRGDEFFSWTETVDGFAVLYDEVDSLWKYAQPMEGQPAFEIIPTPPIPPPPPPVVGLVNPLDYGLIPHAMPDDALLKEARREQWQTMRGWPPVELEVPEQGLGALGDSADGPPPPQPLIPAAGTKTIRNIVLLACFSNHWNVAGGTVGSSYGKTQNDYTNLFNQVGYSADSAVGSVRDYYKEVSYTRLTVESVVFKWVRLPQNESYYGTDGTGGTVKDLKWLEMISDAIAAADSAGLNFATGDSDGDGWVDCLTVIHSGHGQEITGNPATCIWSKQGEMSSVITKGGVKMKRAHTEPALRGLTTSTSIIRIGVICHEMGHSFGLPDLYDYSNATDGIGKWCLMAHGNWNGSEGHRPAHLSAYAKCMLGFVRPTTLHTQSSASLPRVELHDSVIFLRDGMSNGEYYLLENRSRYGFDNDTASIFPGVLIYHVDSKSLNNDLGTWTHPLVKIEEADGDNSLGTIESPTPVQSEAGDVWTSTSGLSGGFRDQKATPPPTPCCINTCPMSAPTTRPPTHICARPTSRRRAA